MPGWSSIAGSTVDQCIADAFGAYGLWVLRPPAPSLPACVPSHRHGACVVGGNKFQRKKHALENTSYPGLTRDPAVFQDALYFVLLSPPPGGSGEGPDCHLSAGIDDCDPVPTQIRGGIFSPSAQLG